MTGKNASNFLEYQVSKMFKGFLYGGKVGKHCLRALNKCVLALETQEKLAEGLGTVGGGFIQKFGSHKHKIMLVTDSSGCSSNPDGKKETSALGGCNSIPKSLRTTNVNATNLKVKF